jgi:hypothetical protein
MDVVIRAAYAIQYRAVLDVQVLDGAVAAL